MSSLVAETRNWDEESSVNITQKEKLLWTGCIWRQWKFCNSHHSTLSNRKKSTSTARETSGKTSMIMDRKVRGKHLSWDTVFTFMRLQTTSRNLGERLGGLVFSERPRSTMEHRAWWSTMTHLVTKNPKKNVLVRILQEFAGIWCWAYDRRFLSFPTRCDRFAHYHPGRTCRNFAWWNLSA